MSDNIKLVIEIDKRAYKACRELRTNNDDGITGLCAVNAIANGTPLDNNSERAEVQAYGWEQGRKALIDEIKKEIRKNFSDNAYIHVPYVLNILANIDKAESEVSE